MHRSSRWLLWLVPLASSGLGPPVEAHEGVHGQIEALTRRIAREPDSASLRLRRGELFRRHGDVERALADFARAEALDPSLADVLLARGRALLGAGRPEEALEALRAFLARRPDDGAALVETGRALRDLHRPLAAARAYSLAIRVLPDRQPSVYVERALTLGEAGDGHLDAAVRGLDEGLADLGHSIPLELLAIELELRRHRHGEALRRIDGILATAQRKEPWLVRRAEVLEQAGRAAEARAAWEAARDAIRALPSRHRRSPATRDLESRVTERLDRPAERRE